MTDSEKVEELKKKLNELNSFKSGLSDDNLDEFNKLKQEILDLMDDNQKLRFNRINFFRKVQDYSDSNIDDLPF